MAVQPGEIKIIPPIQELLSGDGNRSYMVNKIWFSIRGEGTYHVEVPQEGYTADKAQAAILKKANEIVATLDLF